VIRATRAIESQNEDRRFAALQNLFVEVQVTGNFLQNFPVNKGNAQPLGQLFSQVRSPAPQLVTDGDHIRLIGHGRFLPMSS
jgi:hypothetical protein